LKRAAHIFTHYIFNLLSCIWLLWTQCNYVRMFGIHKPSLRMCGPLNHLRSVRICGPSQTPAICTNRPMWVWHCNDWHCFKTFFFLLVLLSKSQWEKWFVWTFKIKDITLAVKNHRKICLLDYWTKYSSLKICNLKYI